METSTATRSSSTLSTSAAAKSASITIENPAPPTKIKNTLNVFQGAALIIGATIGSGIYITPGKIVNDVGAIIPALGLWVFASVVAFIAAMNYAELGSRITESGGDAPFLNAGFPKSNQLVACLYSWTRVSLVNPGYNACLSYTAAKYFLAAFPVTTYVRTLGSLLLLLLTCTCIPSNLTASRFIACFTLVSIGSLLMLGILGVLVICGVFPDLFVSESFSSKHLVQGTSTEIGKWASATYAVLWSFDGFSNLTSSLSELSNPTVNIQRSTMMGIATVSILYLLANVAFCVMMPFDLLISAGDQLASEWSKLVFGRGGQIAVALMIAISSLSCCYVCVFSASRIAQATGNSDLIYPPKFFKKLNQYTGTPVNALVLNYVLACVLLWVPPTEQVFWFLMNLISYPLWVFYGLTAVSLVLIKRRQSDLGVMVYDGLTVHWFGPWFIMICSLFLVVFPYFDSELAIPSALSWVYIGFGFGSYYLLKR